LFGNSVWPDATPWLCFFIPFQFLGFFPSSTKILFGWAVTFEKVIVSGRKAVVEKAKDRLIRRAVKL
jgi:hypothetical protein